MSNGDVIIICGTAGEPITDKDITVYDAPVASIAIKFDPHAAEQYAGVSHRDALRLKRMIERDYERWSEEFERLGIPYTRHTPHAQP
jgi:hypothetical protein